MGFSLRRDDSEVIAISERPVGPLPFELPTTTRFAFVYLPLAHDRRADVGVLVVRIRVRYFP